MVVGSIDQGEHLVVAPSGEQLERIPQAQQWGDSQGVGGS